MVVTTLSQKVLHNFSCILLLFLSCLAGDVSASSIIPYPDLGEMAKASECVVVAKVQENFDYTDGGLVRLRTRLVVEETMKGELQPGAGFFIQKLGGRGTEWQFVIDGDPDFVEGKSYLLFLERREDYWRPVLLAYGVFENFVKDGEEYFVPVPTASDIATFPRPDGREVEPLAVYARHLLTGALSRVCAHAATWQELNVQRIPLEKFATLVQMRAPPSQCTFLGSGGGISGTRWLDFPGTALPVRYASAGDTSCSPTTLAHTRIGEGISDMTSNYPGINLTNNGTFSGFTPDCAGGSAVGGNFTTWVNANLGGSRHLVIQFNDPCNEMSFNTGTCSGTLAYGGSYLSTPTHTYDGLTWYRSVYAFVVVNNGIGPCMGSCGTNYKIMVTHEMTHSLGLGHISGSGTANMNPTCCVTITSIDQQCVNYLYQPLLPVELVSFAGKLTGKAIELTWETASEANNAFFTVERSADGVHFRELARINGAGNSQSLRRYTWLDKQYQPGVNYYRLSQTDLDGTTEVFSNIAAVEAYPDRATLRLHKSPFSPVLYTLDIYQNAPTQGQLEVYDLTGKTVLKKTFAFASGWNSSVLDMSGFQAGWYVLKVESGNEVWVEKLAVSH